MPNPLKSIRLTNFRGFRDFTVSFSSENFLVGPNNAGKSTILTALRLSDIMIRYARSRNPNEKKVDGSLNVSTYPIPSSADDFKSILESVHHEFQDNEARVELSWKNGTKLVAVWPAESRQDDPYFYLLIKKRGAISQPTGKTQVVVHFSRLGIIPIISPLEYSEQILQPKYLKLNADSRVSSRHFRNNIKLLNDENHFEAFTDFVENWLPEIIIKKPETVLEHGRVDLYYRELNQATDKEIIWSGDGIQIWLQILLHVYRIGKTDTLILDEPEVYLHPDLQRRLIKLLLSLECQFIIATHSTEIISDAEMGSVIMIDKYRRRGFIINEESYLDELTALIGTSVSLKLVRSLKTKVTLFVEGQDMKLLDIASAKLGLSNIRHERNVSIIPLGGKSRFTNIAPFQWLNENLLGKDRAIGVLLDRDYQSDDEINSLEKDFASVNVTGHVWRRKELESYFIEPVSLSRASVITIEQAHGLIMTATDELKPTVIGQLISARTELYKKQKTSINLATIATEVSGEVEASWQKLEFRMSVCPAKEIIKGLNKQLSAKKLRTVSAVSLAKAFEKDEVHSEMRDFLLAIEKLAS